MRLYLAAVFYFVALSISYGQGDTSALFRQLETMPADSDKVMLLLAAGDIYYQSAPARAVSYYHQAHDLAVSLDYPYGVGKSWLYLGYLYNVQGQYAEGIENNQRAYEVFRENGDSIDMAKALINIGNGYNFQAAADLALPYYLGAIDIFEAQEEANYLAFTLGNVHTLFTKLRDHPKALSYAEKMLNIAPATADTIMISDAYQKIGLSLMELGRFEEALPALEKAKLLTAITQDPISHLISLSNLGEFYFRQQEYPLAEKYFRECLEAARNFGDPFYLTESLHDLGKVQTRLGRLNQARPLLREALSIARENGNKQGALDGYFALAELEEQAGSYQLAGQYWQNHVLLQDTVFDENGRDQVAALNIRYETSVRESRIAALETENELQELRLRQRNLYLGLLSLGLLILVTLFYLLRRNSRQQQEISQQAEKLQQQKIEQLENERDIISLRARMEGEKMERLRIAEDLHDDFGAGLSKIALLSDLLANKAPEEATTLHKIALASRRLQRKLGEVVWALNTRNDSLASLVSYLRHYVQDFFDETVIDYELDIRQGLPDLPLNGEQRRNLFLVIKESLHNVLKHSGASKVTISLGLEGRELRAAVKDDGIGIRSADISGPGNGTQNMIKRMEQMGGTLVIKGDQGTEVSLSLPL